jgi:hypothetical protein
VFIDTTTGNCAMHVFAIYTSMLCFGTPLDWESLNYKGTAICYENKLNLELKAVSDSLVNDVMMV